MKMLLLVVQFSEIYSTQKPDLLRAYPNQIPNSNSICCPIIIDHPISKIDGDSCKIEFYVMSRHDDELRWRGSRQVVGKPGVKRQVANGQIRDRDDVVVLRSNEQLLRRVLHTLLFHYYLNLS